MNQLPIDSLLFFIAQAWIFTRQGRRGNRQRKEIEMQKPSWNVFTLFIMAVLMASILWACNTQTSTTSTSDNTTIEDNEAIGVESETIDATVATTPVLVATEVSTETTAEEGLQSNGEGNATQTFIIDRSQSVASFTLDEELLGVPTTVVGTTSLVSGEIMIDPANPSATTIGTIQIDASDLTTDSERRDGAMGRFILQTNDAANQYITFTPTSIAGLPETATAGDSFTFQITGDLTISGVTNPTTFTTTINVIAENQLRGSATTEILRSNFDLSIPSVPSVANVTDAVQLQLDFAAGS